MNPKNEKINKVILTKNINKFKILVRGPHTGLFDPNGKWVTWLTPKECRELKDLGVK